MRAGTIFDILIYSIFSFYTACNILKELIKYIHWTNIPVLVYEDALWIHPFYISDWFCHIIEFRDWKGQVFQASTITQDLQNVTTWPNAVFLSPCRAIYPTGLMIIISQIHILRMITWIMVTKTIFVAKTMSGNLQATSSHPCTHLCSSWASWATVLSSWSTITAQDWRLWRTCFFWIWPLLTCSFLSLYLSGPLLLLKDGSLRPLLAKWSIACTRWISIAVSCWSCASVWTDTLPLLGLWKHRVGGRKDYCIAR